MGRWFKKHKNLLYVLLFAGLGVGGGALVGLIVSAMIINPSL